MVGAHDHAAYFGRESAAGELLGEEPLDAFVPNFEFVLDDLSACTDAELRERDMSAAPKLTLWALKTARDPAAVKATIHGWAEVFRAALDTWDELILILRYTLDVCELEAEYIKSFLGREVGPRAEEAYMIVGQALRTEGRIEALRMALTKQVQPRFGDLSADTAARIQQVARALDRAGHSRGVALRHLR